MKIRLAVLTVIAPLMVGCAALSPDDPLYKYRHDLLIRADQGDAKSQYLEGMTYCCGFDGTRNTVTARIWLCRAALQGYRQAQYQLGRLYDQHAVIWRQRTGTQDIILSHMWYSLAADQGDEMAAMYANTLEHEMSPRDIAAARKLKSHWRERACTDVTKVAGP